MSRGRTTDGFVSQAMHIIIIIILGQFMIRSCLYAAFVDDYPPRARIPHTLSFFDMHARCQGLCYYFDEKGYDETGACTKNGDKLAFNCKIIFSIVRFYPTCGPSSVRLPYLEDVFCNETRKGNNIYKVTLARRVEHDGCPQGKKGVFCLSHSHVSVVFSDKQEDIIEDYPHYTCVGDEPAVASWHRYGDGRLANKTENTTPFNSQAVGVLWSKIVEPFRENSLLCSFYLSDGNYTYDQREEIIGKVMNETREHKSFQFKTSGSWYVKLYRGLVARDRVKVKVSVRNVLLPINKILYVKFDPPAPGTPIIGTVVPNCSLREGVDSYIETTEEKEKEQVCTGETYLIPVGKSFTMADIDAKSPIRKPAPSIDVKANFDSITAMSGIHKDCMEMKRFCYVFTHERGCLHKEMCHILLAIKQTTKDFRKLHFDIISHSADLPGVVKYVRPRGWASIAFSKDQSMGDDFVITCGYHGILSNIGISINLAGTNLYYHNQTYQSLLKNKAVRIGKKDSEVEPRVMCSFDMENTASFTISKRPFERSDLKFSFTKDEYYVFMAYGTTVSKGWDISYHTFKEVIRRKFSKKNYDKEVSGGHRLYNSGSSLFKIFVTALMVLLFW